MQPEAHITETTKGYYCATSPDSGLDVGGSNLTSLKKYLKKEGYKIGPVTRFVARKQSTVFDPFSSQIQ